MTLPLLPPPHPHRRKPTAPALLLLACCALCACQPKSPPEAANDGPPPLSEEDRAYCAEQGDAAAQALMTNLSTQLKAALTAGGPEQAVTVCQQAALPITSATSGQFDHLTVSRTSLKTRNPKNAPTDRDRGVLESWQALLDQGKPLPPHTLEVLADERVLFYKPIMIQAVCLNCHGDREGMPEGLRDRLANLYPDDQAHGYGEGDLRGAFKVEIDLAARSATARE